MPLIAFEGFTQVSICSMCIRNCRERCKSVPSNWRNASAEWMNGHWLGRGWSMRGSNRTRWRVELSAAISKFLMTARLHQPAPEPADRTDKSAQDQCPRPKEHRVDERTFQSRFLTRRNVCRGKAVREAVTNSPSREENYANPEADEAAKNCSQHQYALCRGRCRDLESSLPAVTSSQGASLSNFPSSR